MFCCNHIGNGSEAGIKKTVEEHNMTSDQRDALVLLVKSLLEQEIHPDPVARLYSAKMRIELEINSMILIERTHK